jgi:hypothetical protein
VATYPGGIPSLSRPSGSTLMDAAGFKGSEVIDGQADEIEAIATELGVNPSGGSATVVARLDALDTTVSGKAAASHTHTAANVTDFAETVRDTIGSALVAGTNVTITVNDGADTITIDAAGGGGGLTEEQAEDIVNGLLVAGSNISLTYDDVANTLTVAVTGLGSAAALSTADIDERARDAVGSALTAGTGITVTPNDGADTITVATSAVLPTVVDAKGDLLVGTAADTVGRLAVGADGHVLTADSAAASGVKWAAAAGGGSLDVRDEGTSLTTAATRLDFVGPGVSATEPSTDQIKVAIPGVYDMGPGAGYIQPLSYGDVSTFGVQSRMYLIPLVVPDSVTIEGISAYVDTGVASGVLRFGVYSTGLSRIYDWGTVAAATSATQVDLAFTAWSPSAGVYYLACVIQTAASKVRAANAFNPSQSISDNTVWPGVQSQAYYRTSNTTGALPATSFDIAATTQFPALHLVRSA